MARLVLWGASKAREEGMLDLHVEKIGELAVVECEGRVVRTEAAFKLRKRSRRCEMRELLCLIFRRYAR